MIAQVLLVGHSGLFLESLALFLTQRHQDIGVATLAYPDKAPMLDAHIYNSDLVVVTQGEIAMEASAPFVSAVRKAKNAPPLLVLSDHPDTADLRLPTGLGDVAILPKGRPLSVFAQAVRDLLDKNGVSLSGGKRTRIKLTNRENEVLDALADGKSNKEIAQGLDIAPNTVRVHVSALLQKLSVRNRVEAAVFARGHLQQPLPSPSAI